jgi:tRNA dimethylallyltransferase
LKIIKDKVIFIVGPTGVGKTQVGLLLSHLLPCEFISADSMQIYKGMDIITDKPSKEIRQKYPHHLIDLITPAQEYDVSLFCKAAKKAIDEILARKKIPIVIGGTGLYINSLLYGIFEKELKDENVRKKLEAEIQEKGSIALYERLKNVDQEAAAKMDPNNARRIIRALEVYELSKTPISVLQKQKRGLINERKVSIFGLRRDRKDLYQRIDQRVDFMVNAGLLDEIRSLLTQNLSKTAYLCIGVREMEKFLKGEHDLNEAIRLIKRNSRHYAKRQMTWFNKNKDIEWIDLKADEDLATVAQKIFDKVAGN